jgi:hypothetical protein
VASCQFTKTYTLTAVKKSDNTPVASIPWLSVDSSTSSHKLAVSDKAADHIEGWYVVTVKSKLYTGNEASFIFEIITNPDPCIKAVIKPELVGNMSYDMKPTPALTKGPFDSFTYVVPVTVPATTCGNIKYTLFPSVTVKLTGSIS